MSGEQWQWAMGSLFFGIVRMRAAVLRATPSGALLILLAVASCDGPAGPSSLPTAVSVELIQGQHQRALLNDVLPESVAIRVVDSVTAEPLAGRAVRLVVVSGGGSVSLSAAQTDAAGRVAAAWRLGMGTDTQRLEVRVLGTDTTTVARTATFASLAINPRIQQVSGDGQTAFVTDPLPAPLVVQVTDSASGNPVAGLALRFVVTSGGGGSSDTATVTDAAGQSSVAWTLGPSLVAQRLEVRALGSDTTSPLEASVFSATAVSPVELEIVSGGGQRSLQGTTLVDSVVVRVVDTAGTPVSGYQVSFVAASGGGSVMPAGMITDAGGLARTSWTLGAAVGSQSIEAKALGTGLHVLSAVNLTATAISRTEYLLDSSRVVITAVLEALDVGQALYVLGPRLALPDSSFARVVGYTLLHEAASGTYVIDSSRTDAPIDGTRMLLYDTDFYGTSIAATEHGYADLTPAAGNDSTYDVRIHRDGIELLSFRVHGYDQGTTPSGLPIDSATGRGVLTLGAGVDSFNLDKVNTNLTFTISLADGATLRVVSQDCSMIPDCPHLMRMFFTVPGAPSADEVQIWTGSIDGAHIPTRTFFNGTELALAAPGVPAIDLLIGTSGFRLYHHMGRRLRGLVAPSKQLYRLTL